MAPKHRELVKSPHEMSDRLQLFANTRALNDEKVESGKRVIAFQYRSVGAVHKRGTSTS